MALKTVAILMVIDTDEKDEPSGTCRTDQLVDPKVRLKLPGADETYIVHINDSTYPGIPGKPNKYAMLDAAAHELGHVLTSTFRIPGGMHEDPRQRQELKGISDGGKLRVDLLSADQCRRIWKNEKMAWVLAKQIRPELNTEKMNWSLDTYSDVRDKAELEKVI